MPIRRLSSKLRRHGWALFPAAVSNDLVAAATRAIQADLAQNYEPDRQREYDNISFCPDLRDKTPIAELLTHSSAKAIVDRALSWNEIEYYQNCDKAGPPTDKPYPPTHIDGTPSGAVWFRKSSKLPRRWPCFNF